MATSSPPRLLVAWSGAEFSAVRDLLAAGRLPVLASRLATEDALSPLRTPVASPLALAVTLASGASPAQHGLLAPVQPAPAPDSRGWLVATARHWSTPPVWDLVAAAGKSTAVVGWPATHAAKVHSLRPLASDLDLAAVDVVLRPLDALPGCACEDDMIRVALADLDPALLGFFIPAAESPAEPGRDPLVRGLLRHLALLYSTHNTAISLLNTPGAVRAPALLAVHYVLPTFSAADRLRHPRLQEAALRLLDLLLGDLLRHAPGALLHLAGLAPAAGFLVASKKTPAPERLAEVAPALAASLGLAPVQITPPRSPSPIDEAALLERCRALGLAPFATTQPPTEAARSSHLAALGHLFIAEGRPAEALPLLAAAHFALPEQTGHALSLYDCLHRLGLREEAHDQAAALRDHADTNSHARLIEAEIALHHLRDPGRCLRLLPPVFKDPRLVRFAAPLYREALLHLGRFEEARRLLEAALAAEPRLVADTHAGLAYACFHLGDHVAAETAARSALALGCSRPQPAHILAHLHARRAGKPAPAAPIPSWDALLGDASRREEHRRAYADLRAAFLRERRARRAADAPIAFVNGTPAPPPDATWTIVTGAPRSGLALLLRMLAFGGHPVLTDGARPPDSNNPCGYFEWTPAAEIARHPRLLDEAANHAVKIPADALGGLPRDRRYRVLFVVRDPRETARSQATAQGLPPPDDDAVQALARSLTALLEAARAHPSFDLLEVPYADLRAQPAAWAARLRDFLGHDRVRRPEAMPAAVRADLPRHRQP